MSNINDFFKARGAGQGSLPFYEDTHDSAGNFVGGGQPAPQAGVQTSFVPQSASSAYQQHQQQQSVPPMYTFMPVQQQAGYAPPQPQMPQQPPQMQMASPQNSSLYTTPLGKSNSLAQIQSQRPYSNMVVYEPRTPEEVQTLIDYLTRHEPAIINLDNVEPDVSQRVLDFVSGATYALGGTVNRISGNIFLLSPQGVDVNTIE